LSFTFTNMSNDSTVLSSTEKAKVADVLENNAQVLSNTELDKYLETQPPATRDEIIRINTDARPRALQFALLVPVVAAVLGLFNSLRMMRQPDPVPSTDLEGMVLG